MPIWRRGRHPIRRAGGGRSVSPRAPRTDCAAGLACRELVAGAGYEVVEEGFDTFCLRPEDDALTRVFRAAEPAVAGVAAYEDRP